MNKTMKVRLICSYILRTIIAVAAIVGVILSALAGKESFMGGWTVFMYFTIQSNIAIALVALVGIGLSIGKIDNRVWNVFRLVFTVAISLTGFVFCFVLAPTMGEDAWNIQNVLTHVAVPLSSIADFFLVPTKIRYRKREAAFVVIPPLLYVIYAGIGYALKWEFSKGANYPYFFLNWGSKAGAIGFSSELPFMGCVWWILVLLAFLIGVALLYIFLANAANKGNIDEELSKKDGIDRWIDKNIHRDFKDKNIVITGSNSGIGLALATFLAKKGANIYMPVRNRDRGEKAKETILKECQNASITLMDLDQSSPKSIDAFIEEIKKIDVDAFVNNAGVYSIPESYTEEGIETVEATNHLGVVRINDGLFEYFTSLGHKVNVVMTTSLASYYAKPEKKAKKYDKMLVYANSKYEVSRYFIEYAKRCEGSNVAASLTHPGICYTPLIVKAYPKAFAFFAKCFMKTFFHGPRKACLGILLALDKGENGAYFVPKGLMESSGYPKNVKRILR